MDADIEEAAPGSHEGGRCFLIHVSYANCLKHSRMMKQNHAWGHGVFYPCEQFGYATLDRCTEQFMR
jgi:hypothetical protein